MATLERRTLSASSLIGDYVVNSMGDSVGSLKEIMLDFNSGRIAYGVVAVGGFLGIGEKLFAVPWSALVVDTENENIIFDVSRERLEKAPGFDNDNWPDFADQKWGQDVHQFYGIAPYWDRPQNP